MNATDIMTAIQVLSVLVLIASGLKYMTTTIKPPADEGYPEVFISRDLK